MSTTPAQDGTQALQKVLEPVLLGRKLSMLHVKHSESRLYRLENVVSPCVQEPLRAVLRRRR